ncbi:MAG: glycosyltransferase [Rhodobacteraceae bacterium]|jgi:GT2 family glycosyltransferase|nr:glycosyltransferase [Paracoccaceae bacterium]
MRAAAPPTASIVIVSRRRPAALVACLAGVALQDHPAIEVVVVADPAGLAALREAGWGRRLKSALFDEANIAAARNAGLALAAGEVTALLDDDAVPEPTWAARLAAPLADPRIAAAGGFVRGRDGLSWQWRARRVDRTGRAEPFAVPDRAVSLWRAEPGLGVKTEGTNMAVRTDLLRALGGFDPAFRFYLDETDLNLRLAAIGAVTAIVPDAEVHHGFLPSERRRPDRVPRGLHDIGASTAVFLRRHAPAADHGAALARLAADERRRLVAHMLAGRIEPRDVGRLMATLAEGVAEGLARPLPPLPVPDAAAHGLGAPPASDPPPFLALSGTGPRPGRLLAGRPWSAASRRAAALAAAGAGEVATVLTLWPGFRPHRARFDPAGFWEQSGGLWGRAGRDPPGAGPRPLTFAARVHAEAARIARVRPVGGLPPPGPR